jgi:hypothetical protein
MSVPHAIILVGFTSILAIFAHCVRLIFHIALIAKIYSDAIDVDPTIMPLIQLLDAKFALLFSQDASPALTLQHVPVASRMTSISIPVTQYAIFAT